MKDLATELQAVNTTSLPSGPIMSLDGARL